MGHKIWDAPVYGAPLFLRSQVSHPIRAFSVPSRSDRELLGRSGLPARPPASCEMKGWVVGGGEVVEVRPCSALPACFLPTLAPESPPPTPTFLKLPCWELFMISFTVPTLWKKNVQNLGKCPQPGEPFGS